jgi:hypothetical protein
MSHDRRQAIEALLSKYKSDPDFAARLLEDPNQVIGEFQTRGAAPDLTDAKCGGPDTCKRTCGGRTCEDTCGILSCKLSI